MELRKQIIHRNREIGKASSQITLDDDYNLPDYKPDLTKVIREQGKLVFDEIRVSGGHVLLKGVLKFHILYRTDLERKKINQLSGEIPFQESISVDGAEESHQVRAEAVIEDISVSVINSRKLGIRSLIEFHAVVETPEEEALLTEIAGEDTCELEKENLTVAELVTQKKDTLRIRQEVVLSSNKPNLDEILWSAVELRNIGSHLKDGEIELSGEALIYVLYAGAGEEEHLQCFETTVPIRGMVDCPECHAEQIYDIRVCLAQADMEIRPDEDGEDRNLLLEMVLNLEIFLWQEESITTISDIYALDRQLTPAFEETSLEQLLVKNEAKCRIADKITLDRDKEDILQICASEESMQIERTTMTEHGVLAEGTLTVEILYLTSDDAMPVNSEKAYLAFEQLIETPPVQEPLRIQISGVMDQVTTLLSDSRTIEVKAVMSLNLLAFEQQQKQIITDVAEAELDLAALQKRPGIVGYIVREGDRLFRIAKENHTTVENLMETNRLASAQLKAGQKLLIVKTVS